MTGQHRIYLGEAITSGASCENDGRRFVLYYEHPTGAGNAGEYLALDYVAGYLDGATFGCKNNFRFFNGLPKHLANFIFEGKRIRPLDEDSIGRIRDLTRIGERQIVIEDASRA